MHVVVVAGGEFSDRWASNLNHLMAAADLVIAADSGLNHCRVADRWPDLLIGDMDSVDAGLLAQSRDRDIPVVEFPTDKNATDLELALDLAVERGASHITVFAPFGGRLDHEVATLGLLASPRWHSLEIDATDGRRSIWVVRSSIELREQQGQTMTLVPSAGGAYGVSTAGLQWPLHDEFLPLGTTRGVSNVCIEPRQQVSLASGTLLVVVDRDELESDT